MTTPDPIPLLLAVDDAPDQLLVLEAILGDTGCRLVTTRDGREAVRMALETVPDLILLDIMMPGLDGYDVLSELKSCDKTRDVPVIFLTGRSEVADMVRGLELGAADYVGKPFNAAELKARVKLHLGAKLARDRERRLIEQLQVALHEVRQLSGLIPICSHCKKMRNDQGFWQQVEDYLSRQSKATFTHGLCPECIPLYFPDLPPEFMAAQSGVSEESEEADAPAPRSRVLIVDDTPSNIRTLVEFLGDDCETLAATSGPVALELALRERPDLILLDVMMPGMDGHEVCCRLKADPATHDLPIIFITGRTEVADEMAGFLLGAVDYIAKPFSPSVVQARVRTHLELKRLRDTLAQQTREDALTGLANRRAMEVFLEGAWSHGVRQQHPLSAVMLDVDNFKAYNDRYGHPAGDACLRQVAHALGRVVTRKTDLVVRYGGEEFLVLLPACGPEPAVALAERVRQSISGLLLPHDGSEHGVVTVSLGVATLQPSLDLDPKVLLDQADEALYRAKQGGRNRVVR